MLDRPQKQFGAGQAWRTANKAVEMQYLMAGNGIFQFEIQSNGSVNCNNSYPTSSLYSNLTISERGFNSFELKDKQGRVTHKFQQLASGFTYAITAYVRDGLDRIIYVIPPEVYAKVSAGTLTSFTESDDIFKEGIYGYHYDSNFSGRLTEKHIPGAGWKYSVLDKQEREVFFADESDIAKGYWQFRKFDALGRQIISGIRTGMGSVTRATLQAAFDGMTTETYEEITSTGGLFSYTNRSFPTAYVISDADVRQVTYYDNYVFNSDGNFNFQSANAFHSLALSKGLVTGMLVRNLETNAWYKYVNYFDYKSRPIQSFSQNHLGGIDRSEYQYRFNGEVLKMRMVHQGITEIYDYEYNHTGQKISFKHTKDGITQNVVRLMPSKSYRTTF